MNSPAELLEIAKYVERRARELGADEVAAGVSRSVQTTLVRRDGKIEQASEATSRGLVFSVLVDGKYSSHSTSDLRPAAIESFLKQGVDATRFLEEDRDHALADGKLCGRGATEEALDQYDPAYAKRTADERARDVEALEVEVRRLEPPGVLSVATHVGDGVTDVARAMSNGFADTARDAWFVAGAEITLKDGERRPEASAFYASRYLSDLPSTAAVAEDAVARAKERIGSGPVESGTYTLVLANRAASRLLGMLAAPLSGAALHQNRSCLQGKLGEKIGSDVFTLIDDPFAPRGLGSRAWDGDGLVAKAFPVVKDGVLENYYIGTYYSRKLNVAVTTGGRSNWVVPPGKVPWETVVKGTPRAIYVDGFLGGNSNPVTGDFSFGIRGLLYENGVPTRSLSEMNVSGNVLEVFHKLVACGTDVWPFSGVQSPTLVFDGIQFSGT